MKTILLICIIFTVSTWAQSFVVNKDTIHIYAGGKIWKTSYDNGSTWSINVEFIYGDNAINFAPICKDNYVYYQSNRTGSLMVSSDYGKTFQESKIDTSKNKSVKSIRGLNIHQIKFDGDEMYIATRQGLFISYDKGYILHYKDAPGEIMFNNPGNIEDPEEAGVDFGFNVELQGMVIVDTSLILTSNIVDGGLFRTQRYNKNDSNKTIFYPVSSDYFITKYGRDSYFWYVSSYSITKVKDKIYIIFAKRKHADEYSRVWTMNFDGTNLAEQDYSAFGIENPTTVKSCGDILYVIDNRSKLYMSDDEGQTWQYIKTGINPQTGEETEYSGLTEDIQFNDKYAFFRTEKGLLRATLEDCKITSGITSVEEHSEEIAVYPNPVRDIIRLSTSIPLKLELYDIFGNKILEDTNTQLNVEHLNVGTYYLKYGNETKLIIKY